MAVAVSDPADAELVLGHLEGASDAGARIYGRYFARLARFCRRRSGDASWAEDVAQETILRALDYLGAFDVTRPMWPWLKAIATNEICDRGRLQASEVSFEQGDESLSAGPGTMSLDEIAELQDVRSTLAEALARLPGRQRTAIALRYLEDWDAEDASAFLGLSTDAFAQLLFRARRKLRTEYQQLSAGLGAVLLPLRWIHRRAQRMAFRVGADRFGLAPIEGASSAAVTQIASGMAVLMLVVSGGVSAVHGSHAQRPLALRAAAPSHGRAARPHRHHHPQAGVNRPLAPVTVGRASQPATPSVRQATPIAQAAPANRVAKDVVEPNRSANHPNDTHITSIEPAPGSGGREIFAAGSVACRVPPCAPVLFRSQDGGASWTRLPAAGFEGTQLLLPPSPADRRIFAAGPVGLQVSADGGKTFGPAVSGGPPIAPNAASISPGFDSGDPTIVFASETLMRYDASLRAIVPTQYTVPGPMQPRFSSSYLRDGKIFVGGLDFNPSSRKRVATVFTCQASLCVTAPLVPSVQPPAIRPAPEFDRTGRVYAFMDQQLFLSTDRAYSFRSVRHFWSGVLRDVAVSRVVVVAASSASTGRGGGLYLSHDGGSTWRRVASRLFAAGAGSITLDGRRILVALPANGFACSTDGGRTWATRCR